jgi:hypothetical protein
MLKKAGLNLAKFICCMLMFGFLVALSVLMVNP